MRSDIFAIAGSYALLANAQVGQQGASLTESLTPFQSTQTTCLGQCHIADVSCRTQCINAHNPSVDPILATQQCQAGCVQGDGSAEQTSSYGVCLQNCIDLHTVISTVGAEAAPAATTGAAGSSASGPATFGAVTSTVSSAVEPVTTIGTSTVSRKSAGSSGSAATSGVAASATATGNVAGAVRVGVTGLGLFGLLAAFGM